MKLGRDAVLMVPYKCCCFSARSPQGLIQCGAKIGQGGPLLQETSSSDQKATATNRMHSNDLEACGKKCCFFFLVPCRTLILDFVILAYFNVISVDCVLSALILCNFHVYKWEKAYIKDLNA